MSTCAECRFWKADSDGYGGGQCRRYAPRPAHQWLAFNGEAIIAIADILSRHFGLDWPKGIAGEATETGGSADWPVTYDEEWCGEFSPRAASSSVI